MAMDREQAADGAMGVPAAVQFTGLSKSELYKLMDAGKLAYVHYGRKRLIPKRALIDLLAGLARACGS